MKHFTLTQINKDPHTNERRSSQILLIILLLTCCVRSSLANYDFFHPTEDNPLNIYSDISDLTKPNFLFEAKKSNSFSEEDLSHASISFLKPSATFSPISISGVVNVCIEDGLMQISGNPTSSLGNFSSNTPNALTDNGDGTAIFDPLLAGVGTFSITYTFNDIANACTGSATENFSITACTSTISIIDPCTCRDSIPNNGGNATTTENGQFIETVQLTAQSGQNWYILETDGFFDATSHHPPLSPTTLTTGLTGVTLTEAPAGVYSLEGIHVDALGYSISVTNGSEILSIDNTCFYPNPEITTELRTGYCIESDAIQLMGNGGSADGIGHFDILNEDGSTIIEADVSELQPANLPTGTYQIRYTFDETNNPILPCQNCNPGCVQTISHFVDLIANPGAIACNNNVSISLDDDCISEVLPDMILEGTYDSYGIFDVEITNQFVPLGNTVTQNEIGEILTVKVINTCSGNFCWGSIFVEDKMPPVFDCPTLPIAVSCTADIEAIPSPIAIDNCEGNIPSTLVSTNTQEFPCGNADNVIQEITQIWIAEDIYNNVSENCEQIIQIIRPTLVNVEMPQNYDSIDLPAFDCNDTEFGPEITGYPMINGFPIVDFPVCDLTLFTEDLMLQKCGGSFEIQRTWTVFDACLPFQAGLNPISFTQIIKFLDETSPTITAPEDVTISATGQNCTGELILLPAIINDDCSAVTVTITANGQLLFSNGGFINNLEIGTYSIIYTATDDCNNTATDQMVLTVEDDLAPFVFCDVSTVVALGSDGTAELFAIDLDDGSLDNCSDIEFLAQIMDSGEPFAPSVFFDCGDIGNSIQVVVQIMDESGNANFCMVQVQVQDQNAPTIECPDAITIECTEDLEDLTVTGDAAAETVCSSLNIDFTDISSNLNACGIGDIVRAFVVNTPSGMMATCLQNITIQNSTPTTMPDIQFPDDLEFSNCMIAVDLHPDSLDSNPIFPVNHCELLAVGYEDQVFIAAAPACFKILRTWTIIDWCVYDFENPTAEGIFESEQTLTVIDTDDPVITCPADQVFPILTNDCFTSVELPMPEVEDCNPTTAVSVTSDFGDGFGPFENVAIGTYNATYTADDGCNNAVSCSIQITVLDGKAPTPVCDGLIIGIMPISGMITVNAIDFEESSSDNCTAMADLTFSFSSLMNAPTATFDCSNLGQNTVTIWVEDEAGNQDFCETNLEIQDQTNSCDGGLINISGIITTEETEPVNLVDLQLNGDNNLSLTTGTDGIFSFENLIEGNDYTLTPNKNIGLLNGVTTIDLALITQHILGMQQIDSPYKLIAADINNNGQISTSDVVALRKAILFIEDHFPNNDSWRFIPADFEFTDPNNPFLDDFPEIYNYNNVGNPILDADFIAIKIGDINCNANPQNLVSADERDKSNPIFLNCQNQELVAGDIFETKISLENHHSLEYLQFGLNFTEAIEFIEIIETEQVKISNFGLNKLNERLLTFSWNANFENASSNSNSNFIKIKWRAMQDLDLSNHINLDMKTIIQEIGYSYGNEITSSKNIELNFFDNSTPEIGTSINLSNHPNPFSEETTVSFNLPQSSPIKLSILNSQGKSIFEKKVTGNKGTNDIRISSSEFQKSGIFIASLHTNWGIFKNKVIHF